MQNPVLGNKDEVLLPPPPPPPAPKTKLHSSGFVGTQNPSLIQHSNIPDFSHISRLICHAFSYNNTSVISYYKPVKPMLQDGPCCGIVALSMASQLFKGKLCEPLEILAAAKSSNFTKNGEMFSAADMATLSASLLDCKASVISCLSDHKKDILSYICNDCPVLIPYDADKNHEPCSNKGRNAHWALLNGVCFAIPGEMSPSDFDSLDGVPQAFSARSGKHAEKLLDSSLKTCVYAHQGKSRLLALWDFEMLLASNKNLFEITKKYSSDNMLLPNDDDVLSELRDKAVLLERKHSV